MLLYELFEEVGIVSTEDLNALENWLETNFYKKLGIDLNFTRHFSQRVNDSRNRKPITVDELKKIFKDAFQKYRTSFSDASHDDLQAVLKDLETDINIPFVLNWDSTHHEMDLVAKTIMRKKNFMTMNPILKV